VDRLITSDAAAAARGAAALDATRYDTQSVSIRAPYHAGATDGAIAFIDDAEIAFGNYHIRSVKTAFNGPQVIQELELLQCRV
jgi:hypothetical protein